MEAGIRHPGGPRIRHERHPRAGLESAQEGRPLPLAIVLAVTDEGCAEAVGLEQDPRSAGVLRGDHVDVAENTEGAERDVLQVPDRRRHDVEARQQGSPCRTRPGRRGRT